jgi:hypothetical protein
VVKESYHKDPSLSKEGPYSYQDLSTMVVDNHLHGKNPSAQRSTHQNPQGKTENHQENMVLGHPWVFGKYQKLCFLLVPTSQE